MYEMPEEEKKKNEWCINLNWNINQVELADV